jgi:hypothetical protein
MNGTALVPNIKLRFGHFVHILAIKFCTLATMVISGICIYFLGIICTLNKFQRGCGITEKRITQNSSFLQNWNQSRQKVITEKGTIRKMRMIDKICTKWTKGSSIFGSSAVPFLYPYTYYVVSQTRCVNLIMTVLAPCIICRNFAQIRCLSKFDHFRYCLICYLLIVHYFYTNSESLYYYLVECKITYWEV